MSDNKNGNHADFPAAGMDGNEGATTEENGAMAAEQAEDEYPYVIDDDPELGEQTDREAGRFAAENSGGYDVVDAYRQGDESGNGGYSYIGVCDPENEDCDYPADFAAVHKAFESPLDDDGDPAGRSASAMDYADMDLQGALASGGGVPKFAPLKAESQEKATLWSRFFNFLALGGPLVLAAFFLLQVFTAYEPLRLLWFADEVRQADILRNMLNGDWLLLTLNGESYTQLPPGYFWFLSGIVKVLHLAGLDGGDILARAMSVGAALSGFLFLISVLYMARSVAGVDRRGVFAAGCVVLSVFFLAGLIHYSSVDLLFAALIIFSQSFLFKALLRERSIVFTCLGFACAGLALLVKGPFGVVLPLASVLVFALWRCKPLRLVRKDFLLGLFFAVLPAVIWLGAIAAFGKTGLAVSTINQEIMGRILGSSGHPEPWWYYFAALPLIMLPWSLVLLVLPWHRILGKRNREAFKAARNGDRIGLAFLWICLFTSLAVMIPVSDKLPIYLLPLFGPLAVLASRAVLQFGRTQSMILQRLFGLTFFLAALVFVLVPVYFSQELPSVLSWIARIGLPAWHVDIQGAYAIAAALMLGTCFFVGTVNSRRPEALLIIPVIITVLMAYPLATMSGPSLDKVLSPKESSEKIKDYADKGYYPVSFKVPKGVFAYYAGMPVQDSDDWSYLDMVFKNRDKVVVVMDAERWEGWSTNPGVKEVDRFWLASNQYVLLLHDNTPETPVETDTPEFLAPDAGQGDGVETPDGQETPAGPEGDAGTDAAADGTDGADTAEPELEVEGGTAPDAAAPETNAASPDAADAAEAAPGTGGGSETAAPSDNATEPAAPESEKSEPDSSGPQHIIVLPDGGSNETEAAPKVAPPQVTPAPPAPVMPAAPPAEGMRQTSVTPPAPKSPDKAAPGKQKKSAPEPLPSPVQLDGYSVQTPGGQRQPARTYVPAESGKVTESRGRSNAERTEAMGWGAPTHGLEGFLREMFSGEKNKAAGEDGQ